MSGCRGRGAPARHRLLALAALAPAAVLLPLTVGAHETVTDSSAPLWLRWEFSPTVAVPLLLTAWAYARGVRRLWARAGAGRGVSRRQATCFALGMAILVTALLSPLEALTASSFWLHMVQHLLLILAAPPLLVAGAADSAFLWALAGRWRPVFGRVEAGLGNFVTGRRAFRNRVIVVALASGMLWIWHVPVLYDMALRHEAVHIAEHAGFLLTALLFWASVLRLRPQDHRDNGLRILCIAAMALQGSILGALITFASRPLYQSHADGGGLLGLDPLVDQQLAGLIMWVPPAFLYIGVSAWLFVQWLNAVGRHRQRAAPASRQ